MFHHHHHQGKHSFPSSRSSITLPERHLFLQGTNVQGDTGLVLSTDAKPRLKWTQELHERFIEAVNQLGGADKATPKTVMRLMGIPGLTLYHLKSHLQKYRLSKNLHGQANNGNTKHGCMTAADRMSEVNGAVPSNTNLGSQTSKSMQISEALQMQIEVQRRLHDQLEVQRHLQLRIEAQGKYLQSVLEKAQETLGRQNLGSAGLEAAKVQLSELVSKVSTECLNSTLSGLKEMPGLCIQQTQQATQIADCSMDSCLTSSDASQKDQEIQNIDINLRNFSRNVPTYPEELKDNLRIEGNKAGWCPELNDGKIFSSERIMFPMKRTSSNLSMGISEARETEGAGNGTFPEQKNTKRSSLHPENGKQSKSLGVPYLTGQLDLNTRDENDVASSCKQFDLNGFSWN
ncbi:myb-related protein 2-like [Aristolochia californica]|uniref:myb-related protein 2-like n=1 Tax=Aristolochia californica TaxID=171875 RepID=UPI0035D95854